MSRIGKSIDTKSYVSSCLGLVEKNGGVTATMDAVSSWGDENILQLDCDDSSATP